MYYLIGFGVGVLIYAMCLWAGIKVLNLKPTFFGALAISVAASLAALVPTVGWLLSIIVLAFMMVYFMEIELFPTGIALAVLAGVFRMAFLFVILISLSGPA